MPCTKSRGSRPSKAPRLPPRLSQAPAPEALRKTVILKDPLQRGSAGRGRQGLLKAEKAGTLGCTTWGAANCYLPPGAHPEAPHLCLGPSLAQGVVSSWGWALVGVSLSFLAPQGCAPCRTPGVPGGRSPGVPSGSLLRDSPILIRFPPFCLISPLPQHAPWDHLPSNRSHPNAGVRWTADTEASPL